MNLSSTLLNAFVTLAHTRQFTLAARRCHLSQSAFSHAIARLEAEVGTRLFDRSTRAVMLTPEGALFLPVAQRVLDELQAAVGDLRDRADRRRGKVAIAALPSLAANWIPEAVAGFRTRYPGIDVEVFDVVFERTLSLVREGTADFAINAFPGLEAEFDTRHIFDDSFFLVCQPRHPLSKRRSIALADLAGQTYIHTTRTGSVWRLLYPYLRQVPLRDSGIEVAYLSTLAGMIASGIGVSVATGISLFNFTARGLVAIPISDEGLRYSVGIIRRRGRSLSVAAQTLADLLSAEVPRVSQGGAGRRMATRLLGRAPRR